MRKNFKGFTLIELLIVIAIIAIIAAVVFVALDPLTRFQDARDSSRWSDVSALISAVKIDQVDNGGAYLASIASTTAGEVYLIGTCTTGANVTAITDYCDINPTQADCVDLAGLVTEGYLGEVPISQDGSGTWSSATTGYTLEREASGIVHVRACESENSGEISISR
jgi:prepilin-type N-terminal cleavage/methylation domain-containing protein